MFISEFLFPLNRILSVNEDVLTLALTTLFAALLPFGAPACPASSHQLADRSFFTLCHDSTRTVATPWIRKWAGYETNPSHLTRRATRPSHFRRDSRLAASATDSDYRNSGYTRGYLAPAADFAFSPEAIRASFLLSNAVPQARRLNCGRWSQIESAIRALAVSVDEVERRSGLDFFSQLPDDEESRLESRPVPLPRLP